MNEPTTGSTDRLRDRGRTAGQPGAVGAADLASVEWLALEQVDKDTATQVAGGLAFFGWLGFCTTLAYAGLRWIGAL